MNFWENSRLSYSGKSNLEDHSDSVPQGLRNDSLVQQYAGIRPRPNVAVIRLFEWPILLYGQNLHFLSLSKQVYVLFTYELS